MKNLYFIIALIALILSIQVASASTFINIYLDDSGKSLFLGETTENPVLPDGITLEENIIKGTTQELTSKAGETWKFSYSLKGAEINLIFPEGVKIINVSNGEISLEDKKISVYFKDSIIIFYTVEENNSLNIELILSILIVIIIILSIIYFLIRYYKKSQKNISLVKQLLNPRENLILENLEKHGKTKASHLRKICNIPKASFSRHITELEKKGMIRKSGEGKNKYSELMPYLKEERLKIKVSK